MCNKLNNLIKDAFQSIFNIEILYVVIQKCEFREMPPTFKNWIIINLILDEILAKIYFFSFGCKNNFIFRI